jgi:hypothetical protein
MKANSRPSFDIAALRELAGEKVFARGDDYYRRGQVQILALESGRVLAQVAGTEIYRTAVTQHEKRIGGECTCPAFEDWPVCKHMVATALAANAAGKDGAEGLGALSRIRKHLKKKGAEALVEMIVELAERDPILFRKLDMASTVTQADDRTIEAKLLKAIDAATRTGGFVDYRAVPGWADDVGAALDTISGLVSDKRAGLALRLVERAIDRIGRAVEEIDDSDGHCNGLLDHAGEIHLAAAKAAKPEPVSFARNLFLRETTDEYGTFNGAAAAYADVLGEEGLAEYRRLATEAWQKLQSRKGEARDDGTLAAILDVFAQRDGDVDARIALRAADLSSPWRYLQLAEFCRSQGREEEALRRAEEGLWIFEDGRPDERLLLFTVDLLCKAGRGSEAEAHLWRAFDKVPSLELYSRLRKLGGGEASQRAIGSIERRLTQQKGGSWPVSADLLVHILMREKMFDAAWAVVRKHKASLGVREALARASEATHSRQALEVYAEKVEHLVATSGNHAYEEAARLVERMAGLQEASAQATYVADLKARFGRRRNFMKLLSDVTCGKAMGNKQAAKTGLSHDTLSHR